MTSNNRIVLASRPNPHVTRDNFRLESVALAPLNDGEVRVRNHYLSLDPYMRGRMSDAQSYAAPQAIDEVMIGGTVGQVIETRHAGWAVGDHIVGVGGWQEFTTSDGANMRKVQSGSIPLSAYLGAVGMPGVTAWYGLNKICKLKTGETIVVSAASGAVGSVVGQLAKMRGARVIGIAGGATKCTYVTETLGFDACIDYKAGALDTDLVAATPNGIDAYFENVGGDVTAAVMRRINAFGRVAVCGMISTYDDATPNAIDLRRILVQRLAVEGFIVSDHMDVWPEALAVLSNLVVSGKLQFRESIAEGLGAAPEAFLGLLKGRNLGKQLVKLL